MMPLSHSAGPGASAGTFKVTNPGTTQITLTNTGANPFPVFQTYDLHRAYTGGGTASNTTITLSATNSAQNIPANYIFGNLTLNSQGTKTALGNFTVRGNLYLQHASGIFNNGTFTATVNGSATTAANTSHTGTGKILLTGGDQAHAVGGGGRFQNIELDDEQGAISSASNWGVNGNLALTRGMLRMTTNSYSLTLNGTVSYPAPGTGTLTRKM